MHDASSARHMAVMVAAVLQQQTQQQAVAAAAAASIECQLVVPAHVARHVERLNYGAELLFKSRMVVTACQVLLATDHPYDGTYLFCGTDYETLFLLQGWLGPHLHYHAQT
jgi:hypothetical protein